jgi:hypothetical protein
MAAVGGALAWNNRGAIGGHAWSRIRPQVSKRLVLAYGSSSTAVAYPLHGQESTGSSVHVRRPTAGGCVPSPPCLPVPNWGWGLTPDLHVHDLVYGHQSTHEDGTTDPAVGEQCVIQIVEAGPGDNAVL